MGFTASLWDEWLIFAFHWRARSSISLCKLVSTMCVVERLANCVDRCHDVWYDGLIHVSSTLIHLTFVQLFLACSTDVSSGVCVTTFSMFISVWFHSCLVQIIHNLSHWSYVSVVEWLCCYLYTLCSLVALVLLCWNVDAAESLTASALLEWDKPFSCCFQCFVMALKS